MIITMMTRKKWLIAAFGAISLIIIIFTYRQCSRSNRQPGTAVEPVYREQRLAMAQRAEKQFNLTDSRVIEAVSAVPRHLFVAENLRHLAYSDTALPIGYGQTISAPYIVAWMTEELELEPGQRILEIGTGSGYQAAVLAELGFTEVYSVEIVPELASRSAALLDSLGYDQLHLTQGDGYFGWQEHAPFDAIVVTAAPDHLPSPLVQQLAEGGRMLIPIGPPGGYQSMWKFVKVGGELTAYNLGGVIFVPLVSHQEPLPLEFTTP